MHFTHKDVSMQKYLLFGLMALFSLPGFAADLTLKSSPVSPYLLPVAMQSCHAQQNGFNYLDVPGHSFEIGSFEMNWDGQEDLFVHHLEVRLAGTPNSNPYTCAIVAQEFDAIFYKNHVIDGGGFLENRCSIRCGGVLISNSGTTMIPGIIRVVATDYESGTAQDRVFDFPMSVIFESF